jgi:stage II sporulation protein D
MILAAALVSVRLFWLHPPAEVRVNGTELRADHLAPAHFTGPIVLEAAGSPRLAIRGPLDVRARDGRILLTLDMPLEEYVAGVLAGESSVFRSEEALKAMAVAARTYAFRHRGRHRAEGFDFCDTTHCQDLRLAALSDRLRAAADATEAEMLWYEGSPADTYYSRHCAGTTEAARYVWPELRAPYLKQQVDTFCIATGRAAWQAEIRKADLGGAVSILDRTPSGRVAELRVGARRMRGVDFQLLAGREFGWDTVRSTWFDVADRGDRILFQGYGAGHGVGLCQTGAEQRGLHGQKYRQILAFYYPGTTLGVGARGFPWTRMAGERVEVWSTHPYEDSDVVAAADRALREAERRSGIVLSGRAQVRVYPSVAAYRDATGEAGWIAATTTGRTVRMQPAGLLRSAGRLDATLVHEMLHVAVESVADPRAPVWLREGIVLYLAGDSGPARDPTYGGYLARVRETAGRYGWPAVMEWLRSGSALPGTQSPATPPERSHTPR